MSIATIALIVAIIALVLTVGHSFMRDSDNGGPAHTYGLGANWSWGRLNRPVTNVATLVTPNATTDRNLLSGA